jgi:hypothetical protein
VLPAGTLPMVAHTFLAPFMLSRAPAEFEAHKAKALCTQLDAGRWHLSCCVYG